MQVRRELWGIVLAINMVRSSGSSGYNELLNVAAIKEALYAEIKRKGLFGGNIILGCRILTWAPKIMYLYLERLATAS